MSLSSEYRRQFAWRDWARVLDAIPPLPGRTVLDLGCGIGDLAAELCDAGARVIGVDTNEELLGEARARGIPNAEFRLGDIRAPLELGVVADGLWSSFAAAYLPDLPATLRSWSAHLRSGGWIALTEIDDMFGHHPLGERTRSLFEAYAGEALRAGRYDFHRGRKLHSCMQEAGLTVSKRMTLADRELSFDGPALPEVVDAWRARLDRMRLLQEFCGESFEEVRDEFLGCLTRADHRASARVYCCIGTT